MQYNTLVVLGAVMEWDGRQKRWTFPTIVDRYVGKLVMGKYRAMAAAYAADKYRRILVTGGTDVHPDTREKVSRAKELAALIVRLGASEHKVAAIGTDAGGSTMGNIKDLERYLSSQFQDMGPLSVLCPQFQMERTRLMFSHQPFFQRKEAPEWLSVEDVLAEFRPGTSRWRNRLYARPEAQECMRLERKGIQDLLSGRYAHTMA